MAKPIRVVRLSEFHLVVMASIEKGDLKYWPLARGVPRSGKLFEGGVEVLDNLRSLVTPGHSNFRVRTGNTQENLMHCDDEEGLGVPNLDF